MGTIRPDTCQRNINTGCINMYTRYLHRKRGAYLCSPLSDVPNERISEGEGLNSASEGGRHTHISAFCPRSLESHFNAGIDAWNAHPILFPPSLPSFLPGITTLLPSGRFLRRKTRKVSISVSSARDLLRIRQSTKKRYHPYFFCAHVIVIPANPAKAH